MTTYECACPVCHEPTTVTAPAFGTPHYTYRNGDDTATAYPAIPCRGKHTLREVREALRLTIDADENPDRIV